MIKPPDRASKRGTKRLCNDATGARKGDRRPADKHSSSKRPSPSQLLIKLADGAELFHDAERRAYACVQVDKHRETMAVRGGEFKRWLARAFYLQSGKPPAAAPLGRVW